MSKSRQEIYSHISKLILIVFALLLILVGNGFDYSVLKVDVDSVIVNLGALLLIIGTLQWIFDEGMRNEIIKEISETTLGTDRIYKAGIRDCVDNSKRIDEENIWKMSKVLIVGVHYSNRFFEDHADVIKHRVSLSKETCFFSC